MSIVASWPHADDDALLAELGAALRAPGPVPEEFLAAARGIFAWRTIDTDLAIAELTFDHHQSHPDFIRLVSIENINRAEHMAKSPTFPGQNASVVSLIEQILARGREQGRFAREVDALDVHMLISSYCVFRVANRHTFNTIFGRDLADPALRDRYRAMLGDLVVAYLTELDDDP